MYVASLCTRVNLLITYFEGWTDCINRLRMLNIVNVHGLYAQLETCLPSKCSNWFNHISKLWDYIRHKRIKFIHLNVEFCIFPYWLLQISAFCLDFFCSKQRLFWYSFTCCRIFMITICVFCIQTMDHFKIRNLEYVYLELFQWPLV